MALNIITGMQLSYDAVDAQAYENLPKALGLLDTVSRQQKFIHLDRVQRIASEFPLLAGVEVEYCELFSEYIQASDLSDNDKRAMKINFCNHPCAVILYPLPKLLISDGLDGLPEDVRDTALRHEMVHLEQLVRGDTWLTAEEGEGQYWKGEYFPIMDINGGLAQGDPRALYHYLALPWEQEAYCRTEGELAYRLKLQAVKCRLVALDILNILGEHQYEYQEDYVCNVTNALRTLICTAQDLAADQPPTSTNPRHDIVTAVEKLHFNIYLDDANMLGQLVDELLDGATGQNVAWHPDNQVFYDLVRAGKAVVDTSAVNIKQATLTQLDLHNVPFPDWFVPRFYVKEVAGGYDGCCFVHDTKPHFVNGQWKSSGSTYEIGVSETDHDNPPYCRGLTHEDFLFEIVN
ncbi:hypothetical protein ACT3UJ_07000 [Halomonas sp. 86]|uniref:hypothetical protein n=1 Tax=unclassified Halomonas TaxID=2609666 RepID=UPI004034AA34